MPKQKLFTLLMVDDDDDDWLLVKEAFADNDFACQFELDLRRLSDGQELLEYLDHCTEEGMPGPVPNLILLDLNMPRMGGKEALKQVKSHPTCRGIPIIVFTTSADQSDIVECYQCGSSSCLRKPATFESLKKMMRTLADYWICTAESVAR
jgi:CheY-like chemotaxis protein